MNPSQPQSPTPEGDLAEASQVARWVYWLCHAQEYAAARLRTLLPQEGFQQATQAIETIALKTEDKTTKHVCPGELASHVRLKIFQPTPLFTLIHGNLAEGLPLFTFLMGTPYQNHSTPWACVQSSVSKSRVAVTHRRDS